MCQRYSSLSLLGLFVLVAAVLPNWEFLTPPSHSTLQGETVFDQKFDAAPGGALEMHVVDADVHVDEPTDDGVRVQVIVDAASEQEARDYFERLNFRVDASGRTVAVRTNPDRGGFSLGGRETPHVRIVLRTPAEFDAEIRTADGDLRVAHLEGRIHLQTADGDVRTQTLNGSLTIQTADGDFHGDEVGGDDVDIRTADGDLRLGTVTAGRLRIRTADGDVDIDHAEATDGDVATADGDLRAGSFRGDKLRFRTADGDVHVDELIAGETDVQIADGDLRLNDVEGRLHATTEGDLYVRLRKPAAASLRTEDGDVTVVSPAGLPADIRLRGDEVHLSPAFSFEGTMHEESAEGRINGGGPLIDATARDGAVTMRDE